MIAAALVVPATVAVTVLGALALTAWRHLLTPPRGFRHGRGARIRRRELPAPRTGAERRPGTRLSACIARTLPRSHSARAKVGRMRQVVRRARGVLRGMRSGSILRAALPNLPAELEEPLTYLVRRRLAPADQDRCDRVDRIREGIAAREGSIEIWSYPQPGSAGRFVPYEFSRIAREVSLKPYWGKFVYLAAKASQARSVLELGSCAGVSGAYLASAPSVERLVTVEASPELAPIAQESVSEVHPDARVINALFDDALDQLLPEYQIDLAWIDGHHEREPTLHYFERIILALRPGALVLFDDIASSAEMSAAWETLRTWPGASHALDLGRCGLIVWGPTSQPAVSFDLRALTALGWRRN
jgi:hypothetical protein